MTDNSYVMVYEAQTQIDVDICTAMLEEAGIEVVVSPAGEGWERIYFGQSQSPVAQLFVPAEMEGKARELLAGYQRQVESGAFELGDEE